MTPREALERIARLVRVTDDEAGLGWNEEIGDMVRENLRNGLAEPEQNHELFRSLPEAIKAWREVPPDESGPFAEWLFDMANLQCERRA